MVGLTISRVSGAALLLLALGPSAAAVEAPPGNAHTVVFRLHDHRIDEASGIAVGLRSPGVVYVQNDSGDVNRVFALDRTTGATVATITVTGARNVDWEDLATAPDAAGTPSLWVADIGDNDARRSEVDVYRVDEPLLRPTGRDVATRTARADVWRLRYPNGPVNAESLAVMPSGTAYVVTKSVLGDSVVYRLPPRPDAGRVQTMTRVASITFPVTGTANPFGVPGQLTATGAAVSRDGRRLVVRTYADAYVWTLGSDGLAAALRSSPSPIALPEQPQGEGVTFDGDDRLLVDSEGVGSAVYAVDLPAEPAASGAPATTAAPTPGAATASAPAAGSGGGDGLDVGATVIFAGALVLIGGACGTNRLRVRRARRNR